LRLPELQRDFFRVIAGTGDRHDDVSRLAVEIEPSASLAPQERLDVYARMYGARLVDVLAEDYPRLAAIVGAGAFADLAHAYVAAHPSTRPSLRWFGAAFADFLTTHALDHPPFLPDLARLEWARLAVFDAADAPTLHLDVLRALAPDDWPGLALRPIPAATTLAVGWPVHRIWAGETTTWRPEHAVLRVWRQDERVFQSVMDEVERTAFARVEAGADFAGMCEALATVVPADAVPTTAGELLLRWIADGLLRDAGRS
jgi:hypothetical protein